MRRFKSTAQTRDSWLSMPQSTISSILEASCTGQALQKAQDSCVWAMDNSHRLIPISGFLPGHGI